MKRFLLSALMLGVVGLFNGCGDEASTKTKEVVKDSGGTTTTTKQTKVESTGTNPPVSPSTGDTGKGPAPAKP